MSQTQPEVKHIVDDLFGESSDEEEEEREEEKKQEKKVVAPSSIRLSEQKPLFKSTAGGDEDDLFNSDEDSDTSPQDSIRINKGNLNKKRHRGGKDGKLKKKKKKMSRSQSEGAEKSRESSEDEYDSGEEVVRTKDDDDFLDNEDDDDELLKEYDKDQNFEDVRPSAGKLKAESSRPAKKVNGGGGIGLIDPETTNPFEQTLLALKKNKAAELTDAKKGEIASEILSTLNQAGVEDRELYQKGMPAIRKLHMLPKMEKAAMMKPLQMTLLEYDLLSVLKSWIEPMGKNVLPGLTVRSSVYDVLYKLPCQTDHIKRSQIGKTLMVLAKHKQETTENKRKIRDIIEKWSRPIFGKSIDARNIDIRERLMYETSAERQHRAEIIEKNSGAKQKASGQFNLEGSQQEVKDDGRSRAQMPMNHGLMFTVQPQSNYPGKPEMIGNKPTSRGKAGDENSRSHIVKRLKDMKQNSGKKNFRLIQADIGGRDKA